MIGFFISPQYCAKKYLDSNGMSSGISLSAGIRMWATFKR